MLDTPQITSVFGTPRGDIQLQALQGCWQNVHVPIETYIVNERSVTKLKKITNEQTEFHNVIVVNTFLDRVQWGVKGKFLLKWGIAEELSGGFPEEIYWVQPEEADKEIKDIESRPLPGAPKRWRWRRADVSNLLDEALADLPPVAQIVRPPAAQSPSVTVPPASNSLSTAAPPAQLATSQFSTRVPPTPPPPPSHVGAPVSSTQPSPHHCAMPEQPAASYSEVPVPLVRSSQLNDTPKPVSNENDVLMALQGTWINAVDRTETYEISGLDVVRRKASTMKTFRFRWSSIYGCIEWGLGKYYLQNPAVMPMQVAVWLPSDGQGRSFSWERLSVDSQAPRQLLRPKIAPQLVTPRPLSTPPAIAQQATQPQHSLIPPSGLVSVGRPPADPVIVSDASKTSLQAVNHSGEDVRFQAQEQQQLLPQSLPQSGQQQVAMHMQQQMIEQQWLHYNRQLEQQQQRLAAMHGALPVYRVTPY